MGGEVIRDWDSVIRILPAGAKPKLAPWLRTVWVMPAASPQEYREGLPTGGCGGLPRGS